MKLKEKLAEEYTDPFSADQEEVPFSNHVLDELEKAYLAGFVKAREMAAQIHHKYLDEIASEMIENIGEEEVG